MSIRRAQDERLEGTPDGLNAITEIMDVPDAPTIGTATASGLTASVTFTPATTGGTATTYTVTSTPSSITGTGASSPITVSGLADGTSYTFKVKGTNATGVVGPESSASNSITAVEPLDGAYDALSTVTVGAGGASSITFTSIPAGYKHLQLRGMMQLNPGDGSTGFDRMRVTVNGDTAANYAHHQLYGTGASVAASSATSQNNMLLGSVSYSNNGANVFAPSIIDVLDYSSTNKNKTFRVLTGGDRNSTDGLILFQSGLWISTSPITSITLGFDGSRNYNQYSSFALYGVK
jgi:hypothetical protein